MVRFVAQQARLCGLRALPPALARGQLAQLVYQRRHHRARGRRLRAAAQVGPGGLLFAHRFQRRVGLEGAESTAWVSPATKPWATHWAKTWSKRRSNTAAGKNLRVRLTVECQGNSSSSS